MLNKHCEFLKGNKYKWIIFENDKIEKSESNKKRYDAFCLKLYKNCSYNYVYNIVGKYYFITDEITHIQKMIKFDYFLPILKVNNMICRINKSTTDFVDIMFENTIQEVFFLETKLTPKILFNFYNNERKLNCCVMEKKLH